MAFLRVTVSNQIYDISTASWCQGEGNYGAGEGRIRTRMS